MILATNELSRGALRTCGNPSVLAGVGTVGTAITAYLAYRLNEYYGHQYKHDNNMDSLLSTINEMFIGSKPGTFSIVSAKTGTTYHGSCEVRCVKWVNESGQQQKVIEAGDACFEDWSDMLKDQIFIPPFHCEDAIKNSISLNTRWNCPTSNQTNESDPLPLCSWGGLKEFNEKYAPQSMAKQRDGNATSPGIRV